MTVAGEGLRAYAREPMLAEGGVAWQDAPRESGDPSVVRPVAEPFVADGGLRVLDGDLGRAVIKTSAVEAEHRRIEAPARVFDNQQAVLAAFRAGELEGDFVCVVRGQGPRANGMPELHKLTPELGVLLSRGQRVALVTDGRMSGASGKVPAAIHLHPEWVSGGAIGRLRDGDWICLDADAGTLSVRVPEAEWAARSVEPVETDVQHGMGREMFAAFRSMASSAETGAITFNPAAAEES